MTQHRSHTDCRKPWVPEQQPEEAFYGQANSLRKEKSSTEGSVEAETHLSYLGGEKEDHTLTGVDMVAPAFSSSPNCPLSSHTQEYNL